MLARSFEVALQILINIADCLAAHRMWQSGTLNNKKMFALISLYRIIHNLSFQKSKVNA